MGHFSFRFVTSEADLYTCIYKFGSQLNLTDSDASGERGGCRRLVAMTASSWWATNAGHRGPTVASAIRAVTADER
jgi:hypothetical protein